MIAEGDRPTDGKDGYFDFFFDENPAMKKPLVRSDGSIDYTAMNVVECVTEGSIIAIYHPAVQGKPGRTVMGNRVKAKPAKELPPFELKGAVYDEEHLSYTATRSGRVSVSGKYLEVADILEYHKDLDNVFGSVDFYGDVIVHGNVKPGIRIRATKKVVIDGVLESSDVNAGEDIIVKGGILGNYSSRIECGGSLYADFVEYARINAGGDVSANVFMDCDITARGQIHATGKTGGIIGGALYGIHGVDCSYAGNDAQVRTVIVAGIRDDMLIRKAALEKKIEGLGTEIEDLRKRDFEFVRLSRLDTLNADSLQNWKDTKKALDEAMKGLKKSREELNSLLEIMDGAENARISINGTIFAGCRVQMGSQQMLIGSDKRFVEFAYGRDGQMIMR